MLRPDRPPRTDQAAVQALRHKQPSEYGNRRRAKRPDRCNSGGTLCFPAARQTLAVSAQPARQPGHDPHRIGEYADGAASRLPKAQPVIELGTNWVIGLIWVINWVIAPDAHPLRGRHAISAPPRSKKHRPRSVLAPQRTPFCCRGQPRSVPQALLLGPNEQNKTGHRRPIRQPRYTKLSLTKPCFNTTTNQRRIHAVSVRAIRHDPRPVHRPITLTHLIASQPSASHISKPPVQLFRAASR